MCHGFSIHNDYIGPAPHKVAVMDKQMADTGLPLRSHVPSHVPSANERRVVLKIPHHNPIHPQEESVVHNFVQA